MVTERVLNVPGQRSYTKAKTSLSLLLVALCGVQITGVVAYASSQQSSRPHAWSASSTVLPIFKPVLSQFTGVRVPVYLPSWLPSSTLKGKIGAFAVARSDYFTAGLSTYRSNGVWDSCNACTIFYISGEGLAPAPKNNVSSKVRRVPLGTGTIGYRVEVNGSMGEYFQWNIGKYSYTMRLPNVTDAEYARVARSVVRVPSFSPATRSVWPLNRLLIHLSDLRSGYDPGASFLTCSHPDSCEGSFQTKQMIPTAEGQHVQSLIVEIGRRDNSVATARADFRRQARDAVHQVALPQIGDESVSFLQHYEQGSAWIGYSLLFRRAAYVIRVTLFTTPLRSGPLLLLARLIDTRIVQHG